MREDPLGDTIYLWPPAALPTGPRLSAFHLQGGLAGSCWDRGAGLDGLEPAPGLGGQRGLEGPCGPEVTAAE